MPTTRRRPVPAVAGQFELMLGMPPAADGQLDLVAACHTAAEVPAAARRMAAELSASTGLRLRALPNGAITNAPPHDPATERRAALGCAGCINAAHRH